MALKKLTLTSPKYNTAGSPAYTEARILKEEYDDQGSSLAAVWGVGAMVGGSFVVAPVVGLSGRVNVTNTGYSVDGSDEISSPGAFDSVNSGEGGDAETNLLTWLMAVKTDLSGVISPV
jgi:hypothetical protein